MLVQMMVSSRIKVPSPVGLCSNHLWKQFVLIIDDDVLIIFQLRTSKQTCPRSNSVRRCQKKLFQEMPNILPGSSSLSLQVIMVQIFYGWNGIFHIAQVTVTPNWAFCKASADEFFSNLSCRSNQGPVSVPGVSPLPPQTAHGQIHNI